MAKIKMTRIDYRLIHGQIVAKWIKFRPVNRIVIADEALLLDEFMTDIYKMSAPGYEIDVVSPKDIEVALSRKDDAVMLIFKDVETAYDTIMSGLTIEELNIGAIPSNKERSSVVQGVALSLEEYDKLSDLNNKGIKVSIQPIPENDAVSIESIERKVKKNKEE